MESRKRALRTLPAPPTANLRRQNTRHLHQRHSAELTSPSICWRHHGTSNQTWGLRHHPTGSTHIRKGDRGATQHTKVESSLDSELGNPSDSTRNRFPGPDYDPWCEVCLYARVLNESKLGQRRSGDTCTGKSDIRPPAEPREEATKRTTVPPIKNLVHNTNTPLANHPYPTAHLRMLLVYLAGHPIQSARRNRVGGPCRT